MFVILIILSILSQNEYRMKRKNPFKSVLSRPPVEGAAGTQGLNQPVCVARHRLSFNLK